MGDFAWRLFITGMVMCLVCGGLLASSTGLGDDGNVRVVKWANRGLAVFGSMALVGFIIRVWVP